MADSKEELIDVLDENQNIIDQKPRKYVHKNELLHKVIHLWIVNSKGEVLLQRRSQENSTYKGLWHVGVGGHVDAGASELDTVIRESEEEIGLVVDEKELVKLHVFRDEAFVEELQLTEKAFVHAFLLRKDIDISEFKVDPSEVETVEYISLDKMKEEVSDDDIYWSKYLPQREYYLKTIEMIKDTK